MSNNRVGNNTYAKNNFKSYNKGFNGNTQRYYINSNQISNSINSYDNLNYESKHLLTGGDVSGAVFINKNYDVRAESPGISWVL